MLTPLYAAMTAYLLEQDVLYADETTLQVLKEPDKQQRRPRICGYTAQEEE